MPTLKTVTVGSAQLRSLRGLTQKQLAEHGDVHTPYLQNSKHDAGPSVPDCALSVKEDGELRLERAAWRNPAALIDEWHQQLNAVRLRRRLFNVK